MKWKYRLPILLKGRYKRKKIVAFLLVALVLLSGCGKNQKLNEYDTPAVSNPTTNLFNVDGIDEHIYTGAVPINDCIDSYDDMVEEIQDKEYKHLSFDECKFAPLNDFETVAVYQLMYNDITVEQSLDTITSIVETLGYDDIDLEKEIRDVSGQYALDETVDYPYCYTSVLDKVSSFETGNGFLMDCNRCHVQMFCNGIYSYSDGCITEYMGETRMAAMDAFGIDFENVEPVEEGTVEELGSHEWELIGGRTSVYDAAMMAEDYFNNNPFFPCEEGVTVQVCYVKVYPLKDKYVYYFLMRRVYKGVPFAGAEFGGRQYEYSYNIEEDIKEVYVISGDMVSAYVGTSEGQDIEQASDEYTSIIDLETAVSMIDDKLSSQLHVAVDKVEFVYLPVSQYFEPNLLTYAYPCWLLEGEVDTNGKDIRVYIDTLTGYILYYTYGE